MTGYTEGIILVAFDAKVRDLHNLVRLCLSNLLHVKFSCRHKPRRKSHVSLEDPESIYCGFFPVVVKK